MTKLLNHLSILIIPIIFLCSVTFGQSKDSSRELKRLNAKIDRVRVMVDSLELDNQILLPELMSAFKQAVKSKAQQDSITLVILKRINTLSNKIANLEKVPALVRETNPQEILELALIENIQRADLSALEEAAAYQKLANDFQLTQQEIADRVGKSRTTITNTLRLLELPDKIQKSLDNNEITEGHARALLGLSNAEDMIQNLEVILSRNLNVRQTENIVKNQRLSNESHTEMENTPIKSDDNKLEINLPDSRHISVTLQRLFGTKVTVQRANDGSGTLTIHFYSEEEYEGILSRLIEEENHDNY